MTGIQPPKLDIQAYLERIGLPPPRGTTIETLRSLHQAHLGSIPFENIDVRLGRPVGLDLDSLQSKLVRRRRGGYCFEQNSLFAAALRALGFEVATLEARVRPPGATAPLPRTHMVLEVRADAADWLADVGFGGDGPLLPVPLDGSVAEQPEAAYRIEREADGVHVLRRRWRGEWRDLYAFTRTPALPIDFAVAHHYTSTFPKSPFVQTVTVQRSTPELRRILRGRSYTIRRGEDESTREISDGELLGLLPNEFGLDLSEKERARLVELTIGVGRPGGSDGVERG